MKLPIEPGTLIAEKYRVERLLGQGAMGFVLEVTHLQLEERLAMKFLHPSIAESDEIAERFLREARASRMLKSEHAVKVYDVGKANDGSPFIVMELLEGVDALKLLNRDGPMSPARAIDVVTQACSALAEAHRKGIVHRDLKPENLFVTIGHDGTPFVKVVDFGISKVATPNNATRLTVAGGFVGTMLYVPPEQLRASSDVDARADIWALGVILFELLTGTHPFMADDVPSLTMQIAMEPPASLCALRPDLPIDLEIVIGKCLEKDRERRFSDVAALCAALAPFANGDTQSKFAEVERRAIPTAPEAVIGAGTLMVPGARSPWESSASASPISRSTASMTSPGAASRARARWLAIATIGAAAIVAGSLFARRSTPHADAPSAETQAASHAPNAPMSAQKAAPITTTPSASHSGRPETDDLPSSDASASMASPVVSAVPPARRTAPGFGERTSTSAQPSTSAAPRTSPPPTRKVDDVDL